MSKSRQLAECSRSIESGLFSLIIFHGWKLRLRLAQCLYDSITVFLSRDTKELIQPGAVRSKFLLPIDKVQRATERPGNPEIGLLVRNGFVESGKSGGHLIGIVEGQQIGDF